MALSHHHWHQWWRDSGYLQPLPQPWMYQPTSRRQRHCLVFGITVALVLTLYDLKVPSCITVAATTCPNVNIELMMPIGGFGSFESFSLLDDDNESNRNSKTAFLAALDVNNQLNAAGTPPLYGNSPLNGFTLHWQGSCYTMNVMPFYTPVLADSIDDSDIIGRTLLADQLCASDASTPPQIMTAVDCSFSNSLLYTSLALTCGAYNISTISSQYNDLQFSDKAEFPYSARATVRLDVPNLQLFDLMQQYRWTRATVFPANDPAVPPLVTLLQSEAISKNVDLQLADYLIVTSPNCTSVLNTALADDRRIFFFLGPLDDLFPCLYEIIVVRQLLLQNYIVVLSLETYAGVHYQMAQLASALNVSQYALKGVFTLSPVVFESAITTSFILQELALGMSASMVQNPTFMVVQDSVTLANQGVTGLLSDRLKNVLPVLDASTQAHTSNGLSAAQNAPAAVNALLSALSANGAVGSYSLIAAADNSSFAVTVPFASMRYRTNELFYFFTNASGLSLQSTELGSVLHAADGDALVQNGIYNFDGTTQSLLGAFNMINNSFSVINNSVVWPNPAALVSGVNNNIPPDRVPTSTVAVTCLQCAQGLVALNPADSVFAMLPNVHNGYQLSVQQDDVLLYNLNPSCDGTAPVAQSLLPVLAGLSSNSDRSSPVSAQAASSTVSVYAFAVISTVKAMYETDPTSFADQGTVRYISSFAALAAAHAPAIITVVDGGAGAFNVDFLINCDNQVNNVSAVLRVAILPQQDIYTPTLAAQDAVIALSAFGLAVASFLAFVVVKHRNERAIFSSSFMFLLVIIMGFALLYISALLGILPATAAICRAKALSFHFGSSLALGSIFVKTYRLHRIFNSKNLLNMNISVRTLLSAIFGLLVVDAALMALWIEVGGFGIESPAKPHCHSSGISGSIFPAVFSLIKGVILLCGVYLTFKVRAVPANFNESRFIAVVIYNTTVLAGVYMVVFFGFSDTLSPNSLSIFTSIITLLGSLLCMSIFYAPKLLALKNLYLKNDSSSGSARSSNGRSRKEKDMERYRQQRAAQNDSNISQLDVGPDVVDGKAQNDLAQASNADASGKHDHPKQRTVDSVSKRLKALRGRYLSAAMGARRSNAEQARLFLRAAEVRRLADDYYDELRTLVVDIRLNTERLKKLTEAAMHTVTGAAADELARHTKTVNELEQLIDLPIQQIQYDEHTETYTVLELPRVTVAALSTTSRRQPAQMSSSFAQPLSGNMQDIANSKREQVSGRQIPHSVTSNLNQSQIMHNKPLASATNKLPQTTNATSSGGPSASPLSNNRTIASPSSQSDGLSPALTQVDGVPPLSLPLQHTSSANDVSLRSSITHNSRREVGTARMPVLTELQSLAGAASTRRGSGGELGRSSESAGSHAHAGVQSAGAAARGSVRADSSPSARGAGGAQLMPAHPNSSGNEGGGLLNFLTNRGPPPVRRNVI